MAGGWVDVLRLHLARPEAVDEAEAGVIEGLIAGVVQSGTTAWPAVRLPPESFVGRVAHHYSNEETLVDWLGRVRATDLFLASACAERIPHAIDTLDSEFLGDVPAILARGGMRALPPDDIRQRVRERLFVGASKIADYSGRGALAAWLRVVTLRIAVDARREQRSVPIADSADPDELSLGTDPELRLIKERYREPFKRGLRAALDSLTSEQRNLLKLHFVDGVTLDKLAALFTVHRATVARRIAQAREATFEGVRVRLQAELGIDRDEFDGLLALIRSRLELSLSALLPDGVS